MSPTLSLHNLLCGLCVLPWNVHMYTLKLIAACGRMVPTNKQTKLMFNLDTVKVC